jgi:hypothetical protein
MRRSVVSSRLQLAQLIDGLLEEYDANDDQASNVEEFEKLCQTARGGSGS